MFNIISNLNIKQKYNKIKLLFGTLLVQIGKVENISGQLMKTTTALFELNGEKAYYFVSFLNKFNFYTYK